MESAPAAALASKIPTEELAVELMERARSEGPGLVGPGGLLAELTKRVLEAGLEAEMTEHVGYEPYDPAGHHSGNSRNGTRSKTVITDIGPVEVDVPRDRAGTFEPVIVAKRQRRLGGVDQMVLSLSAKGLTHGEISAHLEEIYGAKVSKETVTRITDRVIETMTEWQNRPLERVYPVVFVDAINVKFREGQVANRPVYVAMGVTVDGERDILGLWAGEGGEGAKYWHTSSLRSATGARRTCASWSATGSPGCRTRSGRSGPRPSCRPASCTCSVTPSGTRHAGTGPRSRRTSNRSTPRRRRPRRWNASPSSRNAGRPATPRSSSCGRTRGPSSCPSSASTPKSAP